MKIGVSASNFQYPYDYVNTLKHLEFSKVALYLFALKRGLSKYKSFGDVTGEISIIMANTTVNKNRLFCNNNYLSKVQEDKGRVTELIGIILTTLFAEKYLSVRKIYRFNARSKKYFHLTGRNVADFYAYDKSDRLHIIEAKGRSGDDIGPIFKALNYGKNQTYSYPYRAATKSACVFQIMSSGEIIGYIEDPIEDLEEFQGEPFESMNMLIYFESTEFQKDSIIEMVGDYRVRTIRKTIENVSFSIGIVQNEDKISKQLINPVYENENYAISSDGIVLKIDELI